ncbi:uroporphyrinogen-III synthase [Gracilimonas mengyeensis]|uniref:Uroporphyrinogen-III synthase n=1 Tax=Gracilimonas mengyeensis TaxID=1302730 RepID=A0A521BH28_9BACT|nr:uroporphyrinogen-III synthase [Gracilimonas mengyeensis]SMO46396.1 uroporphyrinogen-III synthase [Gracilimonas mengyeensis]
MDKKPKILFTTQLSEEKRTQLENNELLIESEPFITFEYQMPALWRSEVPEKSDAWIFTSKKAVKAVSAVLSDFELPQHIFAVGAKTAEKLQELGLKVSIPEEYNAADLSAMMQELKLKKVVHFSGNLKAANFQKLLGDEVEVVSVEVYHTKLTGHQMDDLNDFDGIVFMSPSAVESFSHQNKVTGRMQVFCIGTTTEEAAHEFGMQHCITPEYSTLESLMASIQTFYL